MSALLEIVSPGAMATIQDLGRCGLRKVGVPRSGALEPGWLRLANALLGNREDAPGIEFFAGGLSVRALQLPVRLALAGHFSAEVLADGERRRIDAWRSVTLAPGEMLRCGMVTHGRVAYLAVAGIRVAMQLGSASTYARASLGGLDGCLLAPGACLPATEGSAVETMLGRIPAWDETAIRVVPGPQDDYFDASSIEGFFGEPYLVSKASDRMGMRLDGPLLSHRAEKGVEITSDATVPGSIQVPGSGQPIVLLADGQTAGGYPKIATVISADLPRLGVMAPGQAIRFSAVSVADAERAARARETGLRALIDGIVPLAVPGTVNLEAIYGANLVSGVVDAWSPDVIPLRD